MKTAWRIYILIISFTLVSCGDGSLTALKEKVVPGNFDSGASDIMSTIHVSYPSIADGVTATEVTVTLKSARNMPVVDEHVSIEVTGNDNVIIPCSKTNSTGVSKCRVYSTLAEIKKIMVIEPLPLQRDVVFEAPALSIHFGEIVSSSSLETMTLNSGHYSNSGVYHDPAILKDIHGTEVVHSSFQGIINKGLNP